MEQSTREFAAASSEVLDAKEYESSDAKSEDRNDRYSAASSKRTSDADLLTILNLAIELDLVSVDLETLGVENGRDPRISERSAYALGEGYSCTVCRHVMQEGGPSSLPAGTTVALKKYRPNLPGPGESRRSNDAETYNTLRKEILVHSLLKEHENICKLLFLGWESGSPIPLLALELAAFGSLEYVLSSPGVGPSFLQKQYLTVDIARGLDALHHCNICHVDLKPANILVQRQNDRVIAKITDFGGAADPNSKPAVGTPLWSAPEVLVGGRSVDWVRADIYSFGLIIASLWLRPSYLGDARATSSCYLDWTILEGLTGSLRSTALLLSKLKQDGDPGSVLAIALGQLGEQGELDEQTSTMGALQLVWAQPHLNRSRAFQQAVFEEMLSELEGVNRIHFRVADLPDLPEESMKEKGVDEFLSGLVEGIHKVQDQWHVGLETVRAISWMAFHVCVSYFIGVGTEVNETMGLKWLYVSAVGGHPAAMILAPLIHRSCPSRDDYGGPWRLFTAIGALARSSDSLNLLRDEHPILYEKVINVIKSRPLRLRDKEHGNWYYYETLLRYRETQDRKASLTLEEAIKSRNSEMVRNLLETGADASVIVEGSPGLMHYLSWMEDADAASLAPLFFARGARLDVLATDEENLDLLIAIMGTPLLWAVLRNAIKLALVLLEMHVQHDIPAEDAETVFILAAALHNFELLENLFNLQRINPQFFRFDFLGSSGEDALLPELLILAGNRQNLYRVFQRRIHGKNFRSAQWKTLNILLSEGADPTITIPFGNQGFCNAITNDDDTALRVFIQHIHARRRDPLSFFTTPQTFPGDSFQPNALQRCIYSGAKECFKVILEMVPDLLEKRNARGLTALHSASVQEDTFYLRKLLEYGSNVVVYGKDGSSPLVLAVLTGNIEAANLIAERCSSPELETLLGPSPFYSGCTMIGNLLANWLSRRSMKVIEGVKWVHAKGGSCFFSHVPGNQPAWNVVLNWREPVLESRALLDAKLLEVLFQMFPDKLEWQDFDGMAPLHVAVWNGNIRALKLLIDMGVNINQKTIKVPVSGGVPVGLTARNIALDRSKAVLLPDDVRAGGVHEINKWTQKMKDIVTMLLSHGGRTGNGALWWQHFEVMGRTISGLHVISSRPSRFPIPEEDRMRNPWPEQLPRDESSLSEEEINTKRETLRRLLYEIETLLGPTMDLEVVRKGETTPPEGLKETIRLQVDLEERRWKEGDKLPMGWDVRVTDNGRIYYVDHNTRTSTWTAP